MLKNIQASLKTKKTLIPYLFTLFVLVACNPKQGQEQESADHSQLQSDSVGVSQEDKANKDDISDPDQRASEFETITWLDLIPEDDLEILMNPPEYILELEDGSEEDTIDGQLSNKAPIDENDPYQMALTSTRIIAEMNDKKIRLPGFVVPLEFTENQLVKEFFYVPYFGACIHEPPPPPNQIILVSSEKGVKQEALYQPFWISGTLKTEVVENEMAKAAYVMQLSEYELYTEENAMPEAEFE